MEVCRSRSPNFFLPQAAFLAFGSVSAWHQTMRMFNRSSAFGWDSHLQPMKAIGETRTGIRVGQILLALSEVLPALVMHGENVCVRKCPRRCNRVVAIHGEMEGTASLDASCPREEHYRTNSKAPRHLGHVSYFSSPAGGQIMALQSSGATFRVGRRARKNGGLP
jgi:hypothetical protein